MPEASHHIWRQIQSLGLAESINSLSEYEDAVADGSILATSWLQSEQPDCLSSVTAQRVHWLTFQAAHPWAGNFRTQREVATVAGFVAADAWRIEREFGLLQRQISEWPADPLFSQQQAHAIQAAFFHVRFERVHPFRDGNGRVGRALLSEYLRRFGDFHGAGAFDRTQYFEALRAANRGELRPLACLILKSNMLPDLPVATFRSPFRVAPRMFESVEETSLEDDLAWSRNPRA
jgi:fido (protein-threonine AMPylation protein)